MSRTILLGAHTHESASGTKVNIWIRSGKYLARGSYHGERFGENLGESESSASTRLCELLIAIGNDSYVRPSDAAKRPLARRSCARLTVAELANEYLTEVRGIHGAATEETYRSRLRPILDFAERSDSLKRWRYAQDVDRSFAIELRKFLNEYQTTRNGRPGGKAKNFSAAQIRNVLQTVRAMLDWARKPEIRKLSADWSNPLTNDLLPNKDEKDPFRPNPLPLQDRFQLIEAMDDWQLLHLCLPFILPLRPNEAAGLLISDIDLDKLWLRFGTRMGGGDFTKGRTAFTLPFPVEIEPLLRICIGDRIEGPLLRSRRAFFNATTIHSFQSVEELREMFENGLRDAPKGSIVTEQDRKEFFRGLIRRLGGVSKDCFRTEFKQILQTTHRPHDLTVYDLRRSVTREMNSAGIAHLELRYLTSHSVGDILNEYSGIDPVREIQKHFLQIQPLLAAMKARADRLGLTSPEATGED